MAMDAAMELSFWKEEPLSPVFSGLEDQTDVWKLFEDEVAKQSQTPERDPLDCLGKQGDWLPESPGDSCDSLDSQFALQARAQLASQLLQDLDEVLIKEEPFADPWYETKTDLPMFEELPSPSKEVPGPGQFVLPLHAYATTTVTPTPPAAVHVPLSVVQQQPHHRQHHPATTATLASLAAPNTTVLLTPALPTALPPALAPALPTAPLPLLPVVADTQTQLQLQEFESVFGKVEQSHSGLTGALTPPQSPNHLLQYRAVPVHTPVAVHTPVPPLHSLQPLLPPDDFAALTPNSQQQQLIQEVDEYSCVQQESWPSVGSLASLAPPSPCTSSNSSCSFSSDSPAPASPETDDPEWLPGDSASPADAADAAQAAPDSRASHQGPTRKRGGGRRSKPYANNPEDKRMRKKEQNKNAATRYRMKKKAEVEEILGEENGLLEKNKELQAKVGDLSQEIRYLKNLMREMLTRKGLLK